MWFCLICFKKIGKLKKIVKPNQFYYSLNPSATQITYCRRYSHIIDVTFTPHFQRQSLKKKNCLSDLKICRVSAWNLYSNY